MSLRRFCGIVALAIFAVNVIVHLLTFMPVLHSSVDLRWLSLPLSFAIFPIFALMVLSLANRPRTPLKRADGIFAKWAAIRQRKTDDQARLLALVPKSLRILCGSFFAYAMINFLIVGIQLPGAPVRSKDGTYYLQSRGTKIRDITRLEYVEYRAYRDRLATGHLMLFSLIPAAYFLTVHHRLYLLVDQTENEPNHDVHRRTA